jgi:DNA-binding MarR family transcriptional regulator
VLLTRSGITRLIQGLEREGLVARTDCPDDARGFLVALTPEGADLVRRARTTHLARVAELFSDRYDDEELAQLARLLERLPG